MAHILVLDDVLDAAVLTRRILSKKGHRVEIFTDEQEALRYALTNRVDLAILDINLKKSNGIAVLTQLKAANPSIRVIMLTGYPTVETARQATRLGAADYCVKPIDKSELEQKVSAALALGASTGKPQARES